MNKLSYRQGAALRDIGNEIKKGQFIQIVSEEKDTYIIRKCYASPTEKVNKNFITTI